MDSFKKYLADKKTGNCYEDAFNLIAYDSKYSDWYLVHGIPRLTKGKHKGCQYGHAWLENEYGTLVYDPISDIKIDKVTYYGIGAINYMVKYTKKEAIKMVLKHGTYGAWDRKVNKALHK